MRDKIIGLKNKFYQNNEVDIKNPKEKDPPPEMTEDYHKLTLTQLTQIFSTSLDNGLDSVAAGKILVEYGPNRITSKKESRFFKIVGYFLSGFGMLFFGAAVMCILAWQPIGALDNQQPQMINLALGIMLLLVVIIQGLFNAFQDWSSQKVMSSIKNMMPSNAYVIRDGKEVSKSYFDYVS